MNTATPVNDPPSRPRFMRRSRLGWGLAIVAGIAVATLVLFRPWQERAAASSVVALPAVAVAKVDREDLYRQISIPAEFRAYNEVDVHAKVSGYVQRMNVDIGDKVKAGQLLAVLEIPELGDELDHAVATQRRAAADYKDAHLAYTRLIQVNKDHPNLIAQQDLDTAEARDATAEGALAAAKSDVNKDQTLVGYTRITAPFGGVITKRYVDPGSLIQAGTASQAVPILRVSDNLRLRLDFPVPVDYVSGIRVDEPLTVRIDSLGGRTLEGKISRFTDHIDENTRTMTAEIEVANQKLEFVPGMYATVTLKVDERRNVLAVPVEAVPSGGKTVAVVNAANQVEERPIELGLETPGKYEVLSGLNEGDLVVIGNVAQLRAGQKVAPQLTESLARQ
jgi:RND family efflux transporter MFP subunit